MIKKEIVTINGNTFTKTFSDNGFYIVRNGILYKEAYDPILISREYKESDKLIKN